MFATESRPIRLQPRVACSGQASPIVVRGETPCCSCNVRAQCLLVGLDREQLESFDHLVQTRKRVKRGESLFRTGDPFASLYAIRSGFFKSRVATIDGRDQVTGFQMAGELLGFDGIGTDAHHCDAIALEDSEVCVIPYARMEELSHKHEPLQRHFHKMMSREIVRDHGVMLLLGSMRAEERLASFLLNLSQRFTARGFSSSAFILRMTREEIGSYLGMKLETVSRAFSKFSEDGMVEVRQRHVHIRDAEALKRIVNSQLCH